MTGPLVPRNFKCECGERAARAIVDENYGTKTNRRWHIWLLHWLRSIEDLGVKSSDKDAAA